MDKKLRRFKLLVAKLKPLNEYPVKRRGKAAETLVEYALLEYVDVEKALKGVAIGDRIALVKSKDGTIKCIPIEIKSVTIKNPFGIDVAPKFLSKFRGVYIIIVQREKPLTEYDFLILTDEEMKEEISEKAKPKKWDKTHKEKRHRLKIPRNLAGFKKYVDRWDKIVDYACARRVSR